nr:immunoglobulin heavy chain junction region [Macaca mulatta]MOV49784.1 immunoglobulin heavy chain junction region [Macaca mulatta]MOV50411.1 immunoglobulin heavy chain junction region [Macaca mulatta]MOV51049.1 immunoglobulin heavy chain junction region [Macaca mulatta]MOV51068.1 immunoglobulin heavy chain junction region [Macaca mulatta]
CVKADRWGADRFDVW